MVNFRSKTKEIKMSNGKYPRPWHISHKREHLVDSKYERSDRIPIMDAYGVKICDVENKDLAEYICDAINGVRLPLTGWHTD